MRRASQFWEALVHSLFLPPSNTSTGASNSPPRPTRDDQICTATQAVQSRPQASNIPIRNHLLLGGILVTVNGLFWTSDTLRGWLNAWQKNLRKGASAPEKARRQDRERQNARVSPSARLVAQATQRARESGPVLERTIGPVAYRGRTNYIRKKEPRRSMMLLKGKKPPFRSVSSRNTIRSERPGRSAGLTRVQRLHLLSRLMTHPAGGWPLLLSIQLASTVRDAVKSAGAVPSRVGDDRIRKHRFPGRAGHRFQRSSRKIRRGLPENATTKDAMILTRLKPWELTCTAGLWGFFANIQSVSGTVSNIGALKALASPGCHHGGIHCRRWAHFSRQNGAVGLRDLNLTTYPWDEERMEPDVDAACKTIREVQPKVALFGQSVFLFPTPLEEMALQPKRLAHR